MKLLDKTPEEIVESQRARLHPVECLSLKEVHYLRWRAGGRKVSSARREKVAKHLMGVSTWSKADEQARTGERSGTPGEAPGAGTTGVSTVTGVFRRRNPAGGYRRWVRLTYLLYGGGSLLYGAVLAVRVSVTWYRPLRHGVGATGAAVTLPAVAALFAAAAVLSMRRARRKQAALPSAVAASGSGRPELQTNGGGAS